MKPPLVSIIIPVYNRAKIIAKTLESAITQSYENCEIIVVDNCSTDQTFEILSQWAVENKRIKLFRNESNVGPVKNLAKCLEYSAGEYIKILWSDDYIASSFVKKCLPFLLNNREVGFVFTRTEVFNDETNEKIEAYKIGKTEIYASAQFI